MQREMPLISSMQNAPKAAPALVLRQITSEHQAVDVSTRMGGHKAAFIAASLGRSEAYVSLIRKGLRPIPSRCRDTWIDRFCFITGTQLLRQFVRWQEAMADADELLTQAQVNERLAAQARAA